jgi:hypothetical protein
VADSMVAARMKMTLGYRLLESARSLSVLAEQTEVFLGYHRKEPAEADSMVAAGDGPKQREAAASVIDVDYDGDMVSADDFFFCPRCSTGCGRHRHLGEGSAFCYGLSCCSCCCWYCWTNGRIGRFGRTDKQTDGCLMADTL